MQGVDWSRRQLGPRVLDGEHNLLSQLLATPEVLESKWKLLNDGIVNVAALCPVISILQMFANSKTMYDALAVEELEDGILSRSYQVLRELNSTEDSRITKHVKVQTAFAKLMDLLPLSWEHGKQEGPDYFLIHMIPTEHTYARHFVPTILNTLTCVQGHVTTLNTSPGVYLTLPIDANDPVVLPLQDLLKRNMFMEEPIEHKCDRCPIQKYSTGRWIFKPARFLFLVIQRVRYDGTIFNNKIQVPKTLTFEGQQVYQRQSVMIHTRTNHEIRQRKNKGHYITLVDTPDGRYSMSDDKTYHIAQMNETDEMMDNDYASGVTIIAYSMVGPIVNENQTKEMPSRSQPQRTMNSPSVTTTTTSSTTTATTTPSTPTATTTHQHRQ